MIVETLGVGTELLLGQVVNTNAATIGERLAMAGLDHFHQAVVGDNLERVKDAIGAAVARSDALIITGGLGPTQDDLTREAICRAAEVEMAYSEEHAAHLRRWWARRGREMPDTNLRQAEYPQGAELIDNRKGTAPGLKIRVGDAWVFAVPGVPQEMEPMVDEVVIPFLVGEAGLSGTAIASRVLRTYGESESRIAELLADLFQAAENPSLAYLASDGEISVRLTARAESNTTASDLIEPLEAEVKRRLGSLVFTVGSEPTESIVLRALAERGWTMGTAESATGGLVASRMTRIPGSSVSFRGSIVAYATDLKRALLEVPDAVVSGAGVVSEEAALEMARGGARALGVDVCVAVTGSAGPDPQEQDPGTMILAVRTPESARARTMRLPGDRERVRAYATTAALHLVRLAVGGRWWR